VPKKEPEHLEMGIRAEYGMVDGGKFMIFITVEPPMPEEMKPELKMMAVLSAMSKQVIPRDLKEMESSGCHVENMAGAGDEPQETTQ
jgi:hypothetical protein